MPAEDVVKTHVIASLRIYIERAVKIKNFHIWDRVIPLHQIVLLTKCGQCVHSCVMLSPT